MKAVRLLVHNFRSLRDTDIESVGLRTRTNVSEISMERLIAQFRYLMTPSNMLLVPLQWSGLGEIDAVKNAIAESQ